MLFGEVMEPLGHGALLEEEPHGSQTRRVQNLALRPPASGVPMSCDLSAFCSCHLLPCLPCSHGLSLWPVNPNKLPFVSGPGHGALAQQQGQVIQGLGIALMFQTGEALVTRPKVRSVFVSPLTQKHLHMPLLLRSSCQLSRPTTYPGLSRPAEDPVAYPFS